MNPIRIIAEYEVGHCPKKNGLGKEETKEIPKGIPIPAPFHGTMYTIAHGHPGYAKHHTKLSGQSKLLNDYTPQPPEDTVSFRRGGGLTLAEKEEYEYRRSLGDLSRDELLLPQPIYYAARCGCCPAGGRWCCRQVWNVIGHIPRSIWMLLQRPPPTLKLFISIIVFSWVLGLAMICAVEGTYGRLESQYLTFKSKWLSLYLTPQILGLELVYVSVVFSFRLFHASAAFSSRNLVLGGIGSNNAELHWLFTLLGFSMMYYWMCILYMVLDSIPKTYSNSPTWTGSDSAGVFANYCVVNIVYPMTLLIVFACLYGLLYIVRRTGFSILASLPCSSEDCWYSSKPRASNGSTNQNSTSNGQESASEESDGGSCSCCCWSCRHVIRTYFPHNPMLHSPQSTPNPIQNPQVHQAPHTHRRFTEEIFARQQDNFNEVDQEIEMITRHLRAHHLAITRQLERNRQQALNRSHSSRRNEE